MTDNSPKAVYLRMLDAYNDGTPDSYGSDKFLEHFADDAQIVLPAAPPFPAERGGKETFRAALQQARGILVNRHSDVLEVMAEGERVVARLRYRATAVVPFGEAPAGSAITCDYADFCTVRDGLIVEYTNVTGPLGPMAAEK